jgi:hypothetical protein
MRKLKALKPITHKGITHKPGDVFDCEDKLAQELIDQGHAEDYFIDEEDESREPEPGEGAK